MPVEFRISGRLDESFSVRRVMTPGRVFATRAARQLGARGQTRLALGFGRSGGKERNQAQNIAPSNKARGFLKLFYQPHSIVASSRWCRARKSFQGSEDLEMTETAKIPQPQYSEPTPLTISKK